MTLHSATDNTCLFVKFGKRSFHRETLSMNTWNTTCLLVNMELNAGPWDSRVHRCKFSLIKRLSNRILECSSVHILSVYRRIIIVYNYLPILQRFDAAFIIFIVWIKQVCLYLSSPCCRLQILVAVATKQIIHA